MSDTTACGGCGNDDPSKRCLGCWHDFGDPSSEWVRRPHPLATDERGEGT